MIATTLKRSARAVSRPNMRFVLVKSVEQQDMQTLHRVREGMMKERTALINRIRGVLSEYGIVILRRVTNLRRELPSILEDADNGLTMLARQLFKDLYGDLGMHEERIEEIERSIRELGKSHDVVRRLETIPGVGYLSATALFATVADFKTVGSSRRGLDWYRDNPPVGASNGCLASPSVATRICENYSSWRACRGGAGRMQAKTAGSVAQQRTRTAW